MFALIVNWLQARVNVIQNDLQAAEYHFNEVVMHYRQRWSLSTS